MMYSEHYFPKGVEHEKNHIVIFISQSGTLHSTVIEARNE